jgi:S1-C subfamily serine protease
MSDSLTTLSRDFATAVAAMSPRVVGVEARPRVASSGVILRPGIVITADHTVRRQDEVRVILPVGGKAVAEIAGRDPGTDIAVLRLETQIPIPEDAPPEPIAPGHLALAIGRTERGVIATMGIVSTVAGPWRTWRGGLIDQFVRLDLALYSSSSGGAVVDAEGRLIGMATAGLSRTSAIAIPIATLNRVVDELLAKGYIARGYLGVGLQPVPLPAHLKDRLGLRQERGVIVLSVEPDSPAAHAGLTIGDVLLDLDGHSLADTDDVQTTMAAGDIGRTVRLGLLRGGELQSLEARIGERPHGKE